MPHAAPLMLVVGRLASSFEMENNGAIQAQQRISRKSDVARPVHEPVFTDGTYIVELHLISGDEPYAYRLAIKRVDKTPIRSWRELQDIKNDVAGIDAVEIEIYRRECEVTDIANSYPIWVMRDDVDLCARKAPRQESRDVARSSRWYESNL